MRRYLREFLSDPRVVDLPRWLWLPILYGPVLTFRPAKTARLYQGVWTEEGSPLLVFTRQLTAAVASRLDCAVELGMRYGNPSLRRELSRPRASDQRLLVVPLFPQYSEATTGSVAALAREVAPDPHNVEILDPYFEASGFIQALAASVRAATARHGAPERWLVSFHGLPMRQVARGDPYPAHCQRTADLLAAAVGWSPEAWEMTYQSRFGPGAWLSPATDQRLMSLGRERVGSLGVICPGFAADCLETVDEIGEIGRRQFQSAGGGDMFRVPCLNADDAWATALAELIAARL